MEGKILSLSCVFNLFFHVYFFIPCPIFFCDKCSKRTTNLGAIFRPKVIPTLKLTSCIVKLSVETYFQSWINRVITLPVLNYRGSSLLLKKKKPQSYWQMSPFFFLIDYLAKSVLFMFCFFIKKTLPC